MTASQEASDADLPVGGKASGSGAALSGPRWSRTRDFPARMSEIQEATAFLARALEGYPGLDLCQPTLFDLRLAITETFANIVEHSYGNEPGHFIHMTVRIAPGSIEVLFEDSGRRPDPRRLRSRSLDEYRERGLGLFLMSRCMDEVEFRFLRDGTNRLRIRRSVEEDSAVSGGGRRSSEHQPFHIAIYERLEAITIRPIGTLDRSRTDPFPRTLLVDAPRVTLDLSDLDALDEAGAARLLEFSIRARQNGRVLEVARPRPEVEELLRALGLLEAIVPDGWMRGDVAYADETPSRVRAADRIGRAMPLLRSRVSGYGSGESAGLPSAEAALWLAPSKFRCGRLEFEGAAPRPSDGTLWILRAVATGPAPHSDTSSPARATGSVPAGEVLFLATVRLDALKGPLAAAQLRAAIGSYPDFLARLPDCTVTAFVQRLSTGLRDLLPGVEPVDQDPCLFVAALEFLETDVRAISGLGPVLATVNGRRIRSVLIGGSENAVIETLPVSDSLPGPREGSPFRILLGSDGDSTEGRGGSENGVVDVWRVAP